MIKCTHYILALEMARHGVGIALIPDFLARSHIDSGTLELFNKTRIPSGSSITSAANATAWMSPT